MIAISRTRTTLFTLVTLVLGCVAIFLVRARSPFPSDSTPEGAYLRIAKSIGEGDVRSIFPYLETDAQWAAYSIFELRKKACAIIDAHYPVEARPSAGPFCQALASSSTAEEWFVVLCHRRDWIKRLQHDLSGVQRVEFQGDSAIVLTVRGSRYPFRKRDNGMWGITLFTSELIAEREKAARDEQLIESTAGN